MRARETLHLAAGRKSDNQQARRPLPGSEAKRNLRSAALDLPKPHDDQWWLVYDLSPPVVFDPGSNNYAIVNGDGSVRVVGDIVALVCEIQAQS